VTIIFDGTALLLSLPPRASSTFEEYAEKEVVPKIKTFSSKFARTDIVLDEYRASNLKAQARSKRRNGKKGK